MNINDFVCRTTQSNTGKEVKVLKWGDYLADLQIFELDLLIFGREVKPYSDESFAIFRKFLEQNNVHYYSAEKCKFSMGKAVEEATESGAEFLIAENMS